MVFTRDAVVFTGREFSADSAFGFFVFRAKADIASVSPDAVGVTRFA